MLLTRKRSSKVKNSQNMFMTFPALALRLGVARRDSRSRHLPVPNPTARNSAPGRRRREHADFVLAAHQVGADDVHLALERAQFIVGGDNPRPDLPVERRATPRRASPPAEPRPRR